MERGRTSGAATRMLSSTLPPPPPACQHPTSTARPCLFLPPNQHASKERFWFLEEAPCRSDRQTRCVGRVTSAVADA